MNRVQRPVWRGRWWFLTRTAGSFNDMDAQGAGILHEDELHVNRLFVVTVSEERCRWTYLPDSGMATHTSI